ncbi:uncharacterized protein LOC121990753 [Zingiber officinale]|uniref:uncharacterized protein LOC121990753 n=1 Tax=Zingiber officinale TaxID=94328 RepID=UPI001C4BC938|nr:uncharacterized protein LOC121990753 [Zingiber officinale]
MAAGDDVPPRLECLIAEVVNREVVVVRRLLCLTSDSPSPEDFEPPAWVAGCATEGSEFPTTSMLVVRPVLPSPTLYGFIYAGPSGHFLHILMETNFKGKKGKETVAKKVILEQLTASLWNNMFFMAYYGLVVEGLHSMTFPM